MNSLVSQIARTRLEMILARKSFWDKKPFVLLATCFSKTRPRHPNYWVCSFILLPGGFDTKWACRFEAIWPTRSFVWRNKKGNGPWKVRFDYNCTTATCLWGFYFLHSICPLPAWEHDIYDPIPGYFCRISSSPGMYRSIYILSKHRGEGKKTCWTCQDNQLGCRQNDML
jgi:hypothetical protein